MNLTLDKEKAAPYSSHSQAIRVLTESWAEENLFCPRCGCANIKHFPNNAAVADFYCPSCKNEYELKSKKGLIGKKLADGAYSTFVQRITSDSNPDFFILNYSVADWCVDNLFVIPKHFFTPEIVEKRKPLSNKARRAGWVGCNILVSEIPNQGKIAIIEKRVAVNKESVINQMQKSDLLQTSNLIARGWLFDVLNCVNQIEGNTFGISDVYRSEAALKRRHPQNNNIRPKIRQQLQILRDKGFIEFVGQGLYRKLM